MNADDLICELREALDEPNEKKNYWTNDRLLSAINSLYVELCDLCNIPNRTTNFVDSSSATQNAVASVANSPIHEMPANFIRVAKNGAVYWAESASESKRLVPKTMRELHEAGMYDAVNTGGTPLYYVFDQESLDYSDDTGVGSSRIVMIYPYPTVAGNKLKMPYVARPTSLVSTLTETSPATSATTPVFDSRFHRVLVWGVATEKKIKRGLKEDAQYYNNLFEGVKADMSFYYNSSKGNRIDVIGPVPYELSRGDNVTLV